MTAALSKYNRIVIKVGSALLVDAKRGAVREAWLKSLGKNISDLLKAGKEVIIVSSGAIALGRSTANFPDTDLRLEEEQAAASIGQIMIDRAWQDALKQSERHIGQVLITWDDTEKRRQFLNVRATINTLLKHKAIPLINENDTVCTQEIRYGDNDRLSARIATMANADALILLTDVDGLYSANPQKDPNATHFPLIEEITPEIEAMATGAKSYLSRGGMATKLEAGKMAMSGGVDMIIASGLALNPLSSLNKDQKYTLFKSSIDSASARKSWLAGHMEVKGSVYIDAGASKALLSGSSLLAAGVVTFEGNFERGDMVLIKNAEGLELAKGLIGYSVVDAKKIAGHRSEEFLDILGYPPRAAFIHRDDLVLLVGK